MAIFQRFQNQNPARTCQNAHEYFSFTWQPNFLLVSLRSVTVNKKQVTSFTPFHTMRSFLEQVLFFLLTTVVYVPGGLPNLKFKNIRNKT